MQTRRDFLKLFGKVTLVGLVIAVVPSQFVSVSDGFHSETVSGKVSIPVSDPQHEHYLNQHTHYLNQEIHMIHEWEMPSHR